MPLWAWILFYVLVLLMLIIDLKSFGRKGQHEVSIREALTMTAVWIGVSMVFCAGIYWLYPVDSHEKAMEFLAGYLIEKSLSMDNLFVFLMLFTFFGIPRKYQHEVLFWGIFGALVLRSVFIFAGAAMVERFEWILAVFGVFLIYTGIKMFGHNDGEQVDPSKNIFVKVFKRFFPVTDKMHEDNDCDRDYRRGLCRRLHTRCVLRVEGSVHRAHVERLRHPRSQSALLCSGRHREILHLSEIRPGHHPELCWLEDAA